MDVSSPFKLRKSQKHIIIILFSITMPLILWCKYWRIDSNKYCNMFIKLLYMIIRLLLIFKMMFYLFSSINFIWPIFLPVELKFLVRLPTVISSFIVCCEKGEEMNWKCKCASLFLNETTMEYRSCSYAFQSGLNMQYLQTFYWGINISTYMTLAVSNNKSMIWNKICK